MTEETFPSSHLGHDYPAGPASVPSGLTKPSPRYRRQAWFAFLGILSFVVAYVGLSYWFFRTSYFLFVSPAPKTNGFWNFLLATISGFLGVFLLKGLFGLTRARGHDGIEITRENQPRLRAFVDRIADEAGAPRAHRIFVSARVNAAVFYDMSLINLFFPSKKNLEIGLGLVNGLSLSEFKAVLAHEFGHFGQRSMAIGRWIYIAQQIAGNIVAKRDFLDKLLLFLGRVDLRVAWIGWLLQLLVWSIRSIMDTFFTLVILGQRSLSREMEFQADLVSVVLCGSDALIEGLHRLGPLDEAFDEAIQIALEREGQGVRVPDLFEVQTRVLRYFGKIYAEPTYGATKKLERPESERLFGRELAEPPRMWATHPSNRDREDNAKARYVACARDERPAWSLFDDPESLRCHVTDDFLRMIFEKGNEKTLDLPELRAALNERFEIPSLDERYQGLYHGRSPVLFSKTVTGLFEAPLPSPEEAHARLDALYPKDLRTLLEEHKVAFHEHASLTLLREGILSAPGGVIHHRGRMLRKKDLPEAIETAKAELLDKRTRLEAHDRAVRTVSRVLALEAGEAVARHHLGLVALLHFTSHQAENIRDARGYFQNTLSVVFADGKVSSAELERLLGAANELWDTLWAARGNPKAIRLSSDVTERLGDESFAALFGEELQLQRPDRSNIDDWLRVSEGWIHATLVGLEKLERETLQCLLELEDRLRLWKTTGLSLDPMPSEPSKAPSSYPTLAPGQERERQRKLDLWDRFHAADGVGPTLARLAVAGGVVGTLLGFTRPPSTTPLFVDNGLERSVSVRVGAQTVVVSPHSEAELDVPVDEPLRVSTFTATGASIESFEATFPLGTTSIYNVASANAFVTERVLYGQGEAPAPSIHGNPRLLTSDADYLLTEPPKSLESKGPVTKSYFHPLTNAGIGVQLSLALEGSGPEGGAALVTSHVRWDPEDSAHFVEWLHAGLGRRIPLAEALHARLAESPASLSVRRALQEIPEEHDAACRRDREDGRLHPDDPNLVYLSARCLDDEPAQERAFRAGFERFPTHPWLGWATGITALQEGELDLAERAFRAARWERSLCGEASLLGARVRRLAGGGEHPDHYAEFRGCSGPFSAVFDRKNQIEGLAALEEGEFAEVRRALAKKPNDLLVVLLGTSEGATDEDERRALALFDKPDLGGVSRTLLVALALRKAHPLEKPFQKLEAELGPMTEKIERWLTTRAWRARAEADGELERERDLAILLAIVADPDGVPPRYRRYAFGYFFPGERPYFRAEPTEEP